MANRWFTQFFGSLEKKPVVLSCDFIVDSTNTTGAGLRTLKGPGIANVFMNSGATFAADTHSNTVLDGISSTANLVVGMKISGSGIPVGAKIATITSATAITITIAATATASGVTITYAALGSPNPAAGLILVQFQDNYNRYLFGNGSAISPVTGSTINISTGSSLTVGNAYIITAVGTTTTAQWVAAGLPIGMTPAVGVSFVAIATSGTGTGTVKAAGVSGVSAFEAVGDPNLMLTSSAATVLGSTSGAYMLIQTLGSAVTMGAYTPAGTISAGVIAVAAGTSGDAVTNNAGVLNSTGGQDLAVNAQTFTGAAASLTGTVAYSRTAAANESVLSLSFFLSNSVIKVQGQ